MRALPAISETCLSGEDTFFWIRGLPEPFGPLAPADSRGTGRQAARPREGLAGAKSWGRAAPEGPP